jgi:hypothetical protein
LRGRRGWGTHTRQAIHRAAPTRQASWHGHRWSARIGQVGPSFCWITIARVRTSSPATRSPILIFTRSHPRSLLSIARSNSARSRSRPSRSRKKRIAQICFCVRGRLVPTVLPAFQAARPCIDGSYCE